MLVFPIMSHQFFSRFSKQCALYGLTYSSSIFDPQEEIYHLVRMMSLMPIGAHFNGFSANSERCSLT